MALTKSQRITVLLFVDAAFFLLELIVGYSVHSLALVADSFHMLNDVISLLVGLWAVKVANTRESSKMYTYGWQRAETLGALVNGVFLVALCLTIFLEAIQRLFEPQDVSSPKLVLIVGCCGLLSNILGLVLFHDHGHSHGHDHGEAHSHAEPNGLDAAEQGRNTDALAEAPPVMVTATDIEVNHQNGSKPQSASFPPNSDNDTVKNTRKWHQGGANGREPKKSGSVMSHSSSTSRHNRHTSSSRTRYGSADDIRVHPASFRNEIIAASRMENIDSAESDPDSCDEARPAASERTPLLGNENSAPHAGHTDAQHVNHKHRKPRETGGHSIGHSHGDLNMRGLFLHVMGDALGNIGVIASALVIWLTEYWWRFYSDPLISLLITIIILCSALPLCRAASRILLQAVPPGLSVDDIKEDIEDLPGVVSCHHLHVWQLSDTKLVASLHVQVAFDYKGADSEQYMDLARAVRTCLHEYGIHSSTIQPEFYLDDEVERAPVMVATNGSSTALVPSGGDKTSKLSSRVGSRAASLKSVPDACLLDCDDGCGTNKSCCDRPA